MVAEAPQIGIFFHLGDDDSKFFEMLQICFFFHPSATNLVMKPKIMGEHAFAKGRL